MRPVIASNGVPFLQIRSVGSHSTSGRGKEGKKEGMGSDRYSVGNYYIVYTDWTFTSYMHVLLFDEGPCALLTTDKRRSANCVHVPICDTEYILTLQGIVY